MASDSNNSFGVQKTQESSVRGTSDIWLDATAAGAAASSGSSDPVTGIASAAVGMGVGLLAGYAGQQDEKMARKRQQGYNNFVDSLDNRSAKSGQRVGGQDYYIPQARNGMDTGRYITAEVEGDGSGDKHNGIGEIVTDKKFNVKHIERGSPTHEEGGKKRVLEKGDIVFPSQGSKQKFDGILNNIKRYKLNGDKSAKQALEKERDSLPTDSDYGYMRKGFNNTPKDEANRKALVGKALKNSQYKQDNQTFNEAYYDDPTANTVQNKTANISGLGGTVVNGQGSQATKKVNKVVGTTMGSTAIVNRYKDTKQATAYDDVELPPRLANIPASIPEDGKAFTADPDGGMPLNQAKTKVDNTAQEVAINKEDGTQPLWNNDGKTPGTTPNVKKASPNDGLYDELLREPKQRNNALKYASVFNNLRMGSKPAEEVARRTINYDNYDYRDTSDNKRQSSIENRNYMTRAFMQRADRSGAQGTGSQISAQHLRHMEDINSGEADKQLGVLNMNTQLRNQGRYQNLEIARQDDDKDAQNRAAKQKYLDTAASETAQLAQISEQQGYMRDRNRKQDIVQTIALKNTGSQNFRYDTKDLSGPKYYSYE